MKTIFSYGVKELKGTKLTSILIVIAIILSTMMTTAIGQSIGVLEAMRIQQVSHLNGNRHFTFQNLTKEQAREIYTNENQDFEQMNYWGSLGFFEPENKALSVMLMEFQNNDSSVYQSDIRLKEGKIPTTKTEIALPQDALHFFSDTSLGEKISIPLRHSTMDGEHEISFTTDFTLVGILETSYKGYGSGVLRGVVGSGAIAEYLPQDSQLYNIDFKLLNTNAFQSHVNTLVDRYDIQKVQYNGIFLDALGVSYADKDTAGVDGFGLMFVTGFIVALLVLLAAGLVIYNILKISVSKKARHYGTLRAMGMEKTGIYKLVLFEVITLCVIGIPIGMLLGYFSAESILVGATSFFESNIFLVNSKDDLYLLIEQHSANPSVYLSISGVISLCFALIASLPSAKYASTISPVMAMNDIAVKISRKNRSNKCGKNFYRFYVKLNMKRNRTRTAITIVSLVMSIVVFLSLSAFTKALDGSAGIQNEFNYSMSSPAVGLSEDTLQTLINHDDISTIFARSSFLFTDWGKMNSPFPNMKDIKQLAFGFEVADTDMIELVGLNGSYLSDVVGKAVDAAQIQDLLSGKACIVRNPLGVDLEENIKLPSFAVGDELAINANNMDVVYLLDNIGISSETGVIGSAVQIIMIDTIFKEITDFRDYHNFMVKLTDDADKIELDEYIESIVNAQDGSYYLSYEKMNDELKESAAAINLLAWGLILFIGLIGVLNIINTVYTNIHTRINEIGISRAIGVDKNGVCKMFLWECAYYGIYASVIGVVVGYLFSLLINYSIYGAADLFSVSPLPMLAAIVISLLGCIIATLIPLRAIGKIDIIGAISSVE